MDASVLKVFFSDCCVLCIITDLNKCLPLYESMGVMNSVCLMKMMSLCFQRCDDMKCIRLFVLA